MIVEAKFSPPKWGDPRTGCAPSKFRLPPVRPIMRIGGRFADSYQDIEGKVIVYRFFLSDGDEGWCRLVNLDGDLIEGKFRIIKGELCLI